MPPGPPGRIALRDATACAGRWYLVGAIIGADGGSRPAAWTSTDASDWQPMRLAPATYYARQDLLTSVACRNGRVAALGAKSGGAHGNPRTSSWYQRTDGTLVDMPATFVLYGGSQAISVDRIAAGPDGWLIAGSRTSGAAVWTSVDATDFRIHDHDPALASDADHQTAAVDAAPDGAGWTVVGRVQVPGRVSPVPMAWTSPDGRSWQRQEVPPGTDGFADLERVESTDQGMVAIGIRGRTFGCWRRTDGRWVARQTFGRIVPGGASFVTGLVTSGRHLFATVSDGSRFGLWTGSTSGRWQQVAIPVVPRNSGTAKLSVAASGDTVLLLADDGSAGTLWRASSPG